MRLRRCSGSGISRHASCRNWPVGNQRLTAVFGPAAIQIVELADLYVRRRLPDLKVVGLGIAIEKSKIVRRGRITAVVIALRSEPDFVLAAHVRRVVEGDQLRGDGAAVIEVHGSIRVLAGGYGR